ncbi:hypothetical protein HYT18_02440 [Candidatus Microgenomates bacterium]|nr:hypothetical protein [Candidatus Microgenomates bacterium]
MTTPILHIRIVTPKQILYEGYASSVSSINSAGKFDILPEHANFITLIDNQSIIIRDPKKKAVSFNFPLAIIYNVKNNVNIYTYIQAKTRSF